MKTIEENFVDWESEVFGYGYGTGEFYTLTALKDFFDATTKNEHGGWSYDHRQVEEMLGHGIAWLMINILCHANIIEYGTSPRFAWLTPEGEALKSFCDERSVDELYDMTSVDSEYIHCYRVYCNCSGEMCRNPFWKANPNREH